MKTKTGLLLVLCSVLAFAGGKQHDWQTGRVVESQAKRGPDVIVSDTHSTASVGGIIGPVTRVDGEADSKTTTMSKSTHHAEITIAGGGYMYLVQESQGMSKTGMALGALLGGKPEPGSRRASCRFVIGDDIQYAQEKGTLRVIDADGRQCQMEIVRQERVK